MSHVFGRTNKAFPPVWLSLQYPQEISDGWAERLVSAALAADTVIDISSSPGHWGGFMRGTEAVLMCTGRRDLFEAAGPDEAADLFQAHLLQVLSSIGREWIDFYFLRFERAIEESVLDSIMGTLEYARQEGTIRHAGLFAAGSSLAALSLIQFHDAFEALLVSRQESYETLHSLAEQRRIGLLGAGEVRSETRLIEVSSVDQVAGVLT